MDARSRLFVRSRAGGYCEYCRLSQYHSEVPHQIEHIANLSGIDPATGEIEVIFHPRRDQWADHFVYRGAHLYGLTPSGRTTVAVLALNDARRLELRQELLRAGRFT